MLLLVLEPALFYLVLISLVRVLNYRLWHLPSVSSLGLAKWVRWERSFLSNYAVLHSANIPQMPKVRSRAGGWDKSQASDGQPPNRVLSSKRKELMRITGRPDPWYTSWFLGLGCQFLLMRHGVLEQSVVPNGSYMQTFSLETARHKKCVSWNPRVRKRKQGRTGHWRCHVAGSAPITASHESRFLTCKKLTLKLTLKKTYFSFHILVRLKIFLNNLKSKS